jgi:GNAT superfamily N-acetyltransferase
VSEVTYRFAEASDIAALVELRLIFLAEAGMQAGQAPSLPDAIRTYFSTMLPTGAFVAAIAETGGAIVGIGGMTYDRHPPRLNNPTGLSPYIMNIYVRPEYRRRGIATQLLKMLTDRAKQAGGTTATLHFGPGKSELYAKCGFKPTDNEMKLIL